MAVASLLPALAQELLNLGLWNAQSPPAEALASTAPFAIDYLSFPEWLQFILIPRLQALIDQGQALPNTCGVQPMAEEYFKTHSPGCAALLRLIAQLDKLLSAP